MSPDTSDSKTSRQEGRGEGGTALPTYKINASMDTGFGFGVQCLCYTQVGGVRRSLQRIGRKHHSEPFHANATAGARKRQRACTHVCMVKQDASSQSQTKFANSRGVELESGKEPCEAGKRQRSVQSGEGNAPPHTNKPEQKNAMNVGSHKWRLTW